VLAGGRREDLEYSRDVSDGQRWFLARISPILAPDGRYRTASMLIRDITEQKHAAEQIRRQVEHLNSLREIDTVISSSFDMKFSLEAIVTRAVKDLEVDAADIMVLDPGTGTLEYHAGYGFHSVYPQQATLRSSEGLAGRSLMERKSVYMRDLREHPELLARHFLLSEERFAGYYCVPLINKREIKGVLEIFQRTPLIPHQDWIDFLQTLAGQAAIAIESASLFDGLQRSNLELGLAYDETLEGWSRALDLRDKETEGHTRRVTEVTVRLARAFGFGPQEIQHIRRGALLHDIGKLGVPDEILLKPGPLTDEEWVEMRKHPQFGYDLIAPIRYLQPALDIPYCHHEKWDGSGYPRGLKGDEIPLAARLFAVVDVWDALRHDRPYRTGWPQEKVLAYIRTLDGTHFDPQAVQLFFEVMSENTRGPGE
jgi:HD-GYP domain-containing protein (c-di-GMP phosphodiesterase class II)